MKFLSDFLFEIISSIIGIATPICLTILFISSSKAVVLPLVIIFLLAPGLLAITYSFTGKNKPIKKIDKIYNLFGFSGFFFIGLTLLTISAFQILRVL